MYVDQNIHSACDFFTVKRWVTEGCDKLAPDLSYIERTHTAKNYCVKIITPPVLIEGYTMHFTLVKIVGVISTPSVVILTPLVVILTLFGVMFKLYVGCKFNVCRCGPPLTLTGASLTP